MGDIWQGIQSGVLGVKTVLVNGAEKFSQVTVLLADGAEMVFTAAWDRLKGAAQAVQASFVWVEAKIDQVIDWLAWAFDFKDIIDTANVLENLFLQVPDLAKQAVDLARQQEKVIIADWEQRVKDTFDNLKGAFRTTNFGQFSQQPQTRLPELGVGTQAMLQSGHANWLMDQWIATTGVETGAVEHARGGPGPVSSWLDAIDKVLAMPTWSALQPVWQQVQDDFAGPVRRQRPLDGALGQHRGSAGRLRGTGQRHDRLRRHGCHPVPRPRRLP